VRAGLSRCASGHNRGRMADKDDRAARLAAKLRENLRKRKARARGEQAENTREQEGRRDSRAD